MLVLAHTSVLERLMFVIEDVHSTVPHGGDVVLEAHHYIPVLMDM